MEDNVDALLKWLQQSPEFKLHESISVKNTPESGRGVYLTSGKIGQNVSLISIPSCFQLNIPTVTHHLHLYNNEIREIGHKLDISNNCPYIPDINEQDPRLIAYKMLENQYIHSLSSFQLLSLYIIAEWFLLPVWSDNSPQIQSFWKPFFDCWPTNDELSQIPTKWNFSDDPELKNLVGFLPKLSQKHVDRISKLIRNDWSIIEPTLAKWRQLIPEQVQDQYDLPQLFQYFLRVYFTINSRCLYAEIPTKDDDVASRFTLVPYVDYLNHVTEVDVHCYPKVNYNKKEYFGVGQFTMFSGKHRYVTIGEELYLNYGAHSNDILYNEYGFFVPNNPWNFVDITEEVCEFISSSLSTVEFLKSSDYWGDYSLSMENISYRLTVALSHFTSQDNRRVEKLIEGYISEDFFKSKNDSVLKEILVQKVSRINDSIRELENIAYTDPKKILYVRNIRSLHEDELNIINSVLNSL